MVLSFFPFKSVLCFSASPKTLFKIRDLDTPPKPLSTELQLNGKYNQLYNRYKIVTATDALSLTIIFLS